MKGFIRLSHFKTFLYLGVFLGLVTTASTVTGKKRTIVCPGEQQTTLTCSTNHTFLRWSISSFRQTETRSVPYLDQNVFVRPIMVDSANFTILRVSSSGALPLVTTMTIMNITSNLEGTMITCTGLNSLSDSTIVLMTRVHIYDMDVDTPNAPEITLRPDMIRLGMDNFTVVLEWSQFSSETYTVATVPEPEHLSFIMSTSVQLVMLYNTQYNVAVTATLCGHNATSNLMFYYEIPSVENTAFITAIVISTIVVYISSSVLIFIIGCACGWVGHKHKAKGLDESTHSQAAPGPVYEDLQPSTSMQGDPQEKATFELKENVAYGPIPVQSA